MVAGLVSVYGDDKVMGSSDEVRQVPSLSYVCVIEKAVSTTSVWIAEFLKVF